MRWCGSRGGGWRSSHDTTTCTSTTQSHDPAVGGVEEGEDGIDRSMGVVCQR